LQSKVDLEQKHAREMGQMKENLDDLDEKLRKSQDENFRLEEAFLEAECRNKQIVDELNKEILQNKQEILVETRFLNVECIFS